MADDKTGAFPEGLMDTAAYYLLQAAQAFYEGQENMRRFEAWKEKRDAAEAE